MSFELEAARAAVVALALGAVGACVPETAIRSVADAAAPERPVYSSDAMPVDFVFVRTDAVGGPAQRLPLPAPDPVCRQAAAADPAVELLDDFEDGNLTLSPPRRGAWYSSTDGTPGATQAPDRFAITPILSCAARTRFYAHIRGAGFERWGALIGTTLISSTTPYDLSRYAGLRFWARLGKSHAGPQSVRVRLSNRDTDQAGATCTLPAPNGSMGCGNHFGKDVQIGTDWQQVTVMFSELTQGTAGKRIDTGFDARTVYRVEIMVPPSATHELWVDDIGLVLR